ncbi:MAG: adenosylmethionine--8-amino-7-oxononanoate transaminase [Verrucomicrobia bacterium]|nr:adenosylmethionine--8-amino-7-oxononanoate transaminase [Verrucomicrobiota bacterium]
MDTPNFTSSLILQQDLASVWHPFTQRQTARAPLPIIQAKGAYLYAENGTRYLDGISSWWVNLHGHTHPYIVQAIQTQLEQLEHIAFADFTHAPAAELASRLLPILPGKMSKIFYSDNGSTAVEVAVKMALQYWSNKKNPKNKVLCFKHSYHGDTFGAMSVSGKNDFNKPFWTHLFDVVSIDPPLKGLASDSLRQLQSLLCERNIACFIFEPLVLGAGGMQIYPPEGLDQLLKICKQHDVLTIADEVLTGFGRTNTLFACDQLSEKPDLICLSKGLTGGFLPLGATTCTEHIFEAFLGENLQQAFLHGHSYTANPLACCSAVASLDLLLQPACFEQRKNISSCHRRFCALWQDHPKLVRCESLGTILALEYRTEHTSYFQQLRNKLYDFFLAHGIWLRPLGNILYLIPPYCIQEKELNKVYELITLSLKECL